MHTRSRAAASSVVVILLVLLSLALSGGVAGASVASPTVTTRGVGNPPGLSTTTLNLADVGYQSSEFYLAGNASSYNAGGNPFLANGLWTVAVDATQQPFKTRAQVYRPIDFADFSGTVIVEWLNATNQSDSAADWIVTHVEEIREGDIYVGLTTQAIGVNAAKTADPARYGPSGANLTHPGDSFSYDIFSQGGQAIRDNQALMLGPDFTLKKLIAFGESQSASRMVTYIDALAKLHGVYDGYLVHSRSATGARLREPAQGQINAPADTLIRTDLTEPVFVFQTETDTRLTRQADTSTFRQWEVAGSAHADLYTLGIGQVDKGESPNNTAANTMFDAMLDPVKEPLPGVLAACTIGVNSGPNHWALQAAIYHLDNWVTNGTLPPSGGPGLATTGGAGGSLVLDANGNATGGVRSPHVDVPVATIRGTGNTASQPGPNVCSLFGTTTAFDANTVASLYPSHVAFVTLWNAAVDAGVADGFILPADAPMLKFSAESSSVGKHVLTVLSPLHTWIGLKSDDQGTKFDVRAELLVNGAPVASGLTRCITGVTRNPSAAKEAIVTFGGFEPVTLEDTDVLTVRVSTRIGTNADDTFCGGHSSAAGLRAYYDAATRQSRIDATIFPAANAQEYFHSDGAACSNAASTGVTTKTTDANPPASALPLAKCRDSATVKFAGGNAWQTVDTWALPPHVT